MADDGEKQRQGQKKKQIPCGNDNKNGKSKGKGENGKSKGGSRCGREGCGERVESG